MLFVGLDLSLNHTGIAVVDSNLSLLVRTDVAVGKRRATERLIHVRDEILQHLPPGKLVIAIEGYAMGGKGKVFHIGELGGVVRVALSERGECAVLTHPPMSLKGFATGRGNADKPAMVAAAEEFFKVKPRTDNEADAMHLARVAHAWFHSPAMTARQLADMTKLELEFTDGVTPPRVRRRRSE